VRLLLAIPSLRCGGSERVMSLLADHWAASGHEVALATFDPPETDFFPVGPGVRRIVLGATTASGRRWLHDNLSRVRAFQAEVHRTKPDVVLSFLYTMNLLTLLAARRHAPIVVAERTDPRHSSVEAWQAALRRLLYPRAAALAVQTERVLDGWARRIVPTERAFAVPNPVAVPGRRAWNGSELPERFIVSVGRLGPEKGFDVLIEAFSRIARDVPDWSLVVLGEGPARSELENQVARLGLGGRVLLPGLGDAEALLARAGIFAAASRFEGFPNALLEAMAHRLPAVATDCPSGPAEIIREGVDGFLVPVEDAGALAARIRELCGDEGLRRRIGERGRDVLDRFSLAKVGARWEEIFRAVA
jgi:glycosyltransferase involved in cell wall biosynthesis